MQIEIRLSTAAAVAFSPVSASFRYAFTTLGRKLRDKIEAGIVAGTGEDELQGFLVGPHVVEIAKETSRAADTVGANLAR